MTRRPRPGVQALRYRHPVYDRLGNLCSPTREAKRARRAQLEAEAGHSLSPRQLKRARKALQRALPRTDVLIAGGPAA